MWHPRVVRDWNGAAIVDPSAWTAKRGMGNSSDSSPLGESPDAVSSAKRRDWTGAQRRTERSNPARGATMTTTVPSNHQVLSDELIESFGQRAPTYDRENRF